MTENITKEVNLERRRESRCRYSSKSPESLFTNYQLADWKKDLRKPNHESSQALFSSRNSVTGSISQQFLAGGVPSNNLQRVFVIRDDIHNDLKSTPVPSNLAAQPTKSLKMLREGVLKKNSSELSSNSIFDMPRRCIKIPPECITEASRLNVLEEVTNTKSTGSTLTPDTNSDLNSSKRSARPGKFSGKEAFAKTTDTHYAKPFQKKGFYTNPGFKVVRSNTSGSESLNREELVPKTSHFEGKLSDKENQPDRALKPSKMQACLRDITVTAGSKPSESAQLKLKTGQAHSRSTSLPLETRQTPPPPVQAACKPLAHTLPAPFTDFSVVTDVGICREHNEDKVCVIQRFSREDEQETTNPCGFFGLFDGHGGSGCANFLRDHLYTMLASNQYFKTNKMRALQESITRAEDKFEAKSLKEQDFSGSCALLALVEFDRLTLANVGDSRMLLHSSDIGTTALTTDHKPEHQKERERINRCGGQVYRTRTESTWEILQPDGKLHVSRKEQVQGPFRVEPGGLSVSRTIGDFKVKQYRFGGQPGCVISEPEIREVTLTDKAEFVVLACDGIFDVLENNEVTKIVRESLRISATRKYEARAACKQACVEVIEAAKNKKSKDNLTVVLVTMKELSYFAGQ